MELSGIAKSGTTSSPEATGAKGIGKDEFLKLFTLQLKYQNPLKPLESAEFTSQLAQFSSLEQLTTMSSQLKDLVLFQNSIQNTLATGLVGKRVTVSGDQIALKDTADVNYQLADDASKVKLSIFSLDGKLAREVQIASQQAGTQKYLWDGRDTQGNKLPDGPYRVQVSAFDAQGNPVGVQTLSSGTVTGVTFDNNMTYLIVDGKARFQFKDIKEIGS
jgi:flagellar basal-body rod modification protein FlgD